MAAAASRISPPLVAACAWFLTVGLSVVGSALSAASGRPPEVYLPLTISGVVYATAGALIYLRQPNNAIGLALVAAAALPAALAVLRYTVPATAESSEMHDELVARGGDVERLPRGDVTFLFGDIERSTELLQRVGDAYAGTLARLREIVRREAEHNRGFVVDMRADECFLAFAAASDALASAVEIQRDIERERWPADAEVRLRIGLHAGRPELTASGYVGLDVHHAARVMASALGGQIIASQALVQALGDGAGPDVTLSPLGTFALRGIPGEEALFEVRGT